MKYKTGLGLKHGGFVVGVHHKHNHGDHKFSHEHMVKVAKKVKGMKHKFSYNKGTMGADLELASHFDKKMDFLELKRAVFHKKFGKHRFELETDWKNHKVDKLVLHQTMKLDDKTTLLLDY